MKLPTPKFDGEISLEKTIKDRRTVRSFTSSHLTQEQLSQLTWAAQGITADRGYLRAAASAGALYPIDLYAVVGFIITSPKATAFPWSLKETSGMRWPGRRCLRCGWPCRLCLWLSLLNMIGSTSNTAREV